MENTLFRRAAGITKDSLSIARGILALTSHVAIILGNYEAYRYMLYIGIATDFFDGGIAKATNTVTRKGIFLDGTADIGFYGSILFSLFNLGVQKNPDSAIPLATLLFLYYIAASTIAGYKMIKKANALQPKI